MGQKVCEIKKQTCFVIISFFIFLKKKNNYGFGTEKMYQEGIKLGRERETERSISLTLNPLGKIKYTKERKETAFHQI